MNHSCVCDQLALMRDMAHLLANAHALIPVNKQTVGLNLDIILQNFFIPEQVVESGLGLSQPHFQAIYAVADLADFTHQPVLHWITAQLHVRTQGALV